jgi:hypothetical protein
VNLFPEKDLLGYVVGALDAPEQRDLQAAIDADPNLEEELLAIKNSLAPLEYLDANGSRPGLARRTCELVANIGLPPIRRLDPTQLAQTEGEDSEPHAAVRAVLKEVLAQPTAEFRAPRTTQPVSTGNSRTHFGAVAPAEERTPSGVKEASNFPVVSPETHKSSSALSPVSQREMRGWHWRRSSFSSGDIAVTAAALLILAGVLLPAITYTRNQTRLTHCQNNLREVGIRLIAYSELNQGRFVEIPKDGKLGVAGAVAPILKTNGLLENDAWFSCPGIAAVSDQPPVRIPTVGSIQAAIGDQLLRLQRSMSGHYGYTLGYLTNEGYQPPINMARSYVVLMSDAPSVGSSSRVSQNHGGSGQNLLLEDGHVRYLLGEIYGEGSIFVNDYNLVAPGCRPDDNVIAPSHISLQVPVVTFH